MQAYVRRTSKRRKIGHGTNRDNVGASSDSSCTLTATSSLMRMRLVKNLFIRAVSFRYEGYLPLTDFQMKKAKLKDHAYELADGGGLVFILY